MQVVGKRSEAFACCAKGQHSGHKCPGCVLWVEIDHMAPVLHDGDTGGHKHEGFPVPRLGMNFVESASIEQAPPANGFGNGWNFRGVVAIQERPKVNKVWSLFFFERNDFGNAGHSFKRVATGCPP